MKKNLSLVFLVSWAVSTFSTGCSFVPPGERAQAGGILGAGGGAAIGQAVGHDTVSTVLGAVAGGLLGYAVGNEIDKATQQAAATGRPAIYNSPEGRVEAVPQGGDYYDPNRGHCHIVRTRKWSHGRLVKDEAREVCMGERRAPVQPPSY